MDDHSWIAVCIGAFGAVTWLLGISFFLGRYASRVEQVERSILKVDAALIRVFEKLEQLAVVVPHRCQQESRLAVIEQRQADQAHWRETMQSEHQAVMVRLGESHPA